MFAQLQQKLEQLATEFVYEHYNNPTTSDRLVILNAMITGATAALQTQVEVCRHSSDDLVQLRDGSEESHPI